MSPPAFPTRTLSSATKRAVALYRHQHQHLLAGTASQAASSPSETLAQGPQGMKTYGGGAKPEPGFISLRTLELLAPTGGKVLGKREM